MKRRKRVQIVGFVILAVLALAVVYVFFVRPWHLTRGATIDEVQRSLPGDELVPDPKFVWNQAVTIHAPAAEVWPWVVQIGNKRAGWYSWDAIHRLLGVAGSVQYEDRSADRIIPELQNLQIGDEIRMMPEDMGAPAYKVVAIEPDRALVTHIDDENGASWVWVLDPIDAQSTRLIVRFRQTWPRGASGLAFWIGDELGSLVMQPKTLSGIRQRAEMAAGQ
jgi:hypothetical protein